jgi:hypothetical protein
MKRFLVVAVLAMVALPAALASAGTSPHAARQSCTAQLRVIGKSNFRHMYGSFGRCVARMVKLTKAEQNAILNAARACRAEQLADPVAFATKWGRNTNRANAFGKCVSVTARGGATVVAKRATGDFTFTAGSVANRHVVFDVHSAQGRAGAGGRFSYTDATSSYTLQVSCVAISGNAVYIGGLVQNATGFNPPLANPTYLLAKAVDNGPSGDSYSGSFNATDPCPTLGTINPADGPFPISGSITIR